MIVVHSNCLDLIADFIQSDEVQLYGLIKKVKRTNGSSDQPSRFMVPEKWVNLQASLANDHIIRKIVENPQ
jgi:hypothetical protein